MLGYDPEEAKEDEPHIHLSTDGKGRWWRREWKRQCPEGVFMHGRCQGTEGHKGVHWSYSPNGSYCWDDNDKDPQEDGCSGSTPPGHKKYVNPVKKAKEHYMAFYEDTEVTDPAEIARLERGEMRRGESIDRPCTPEQIEMLKREKRI